MCGIAGIITRDQKFIRPVLLEKMCTALAHRGPDGKNIWSNLSNTVGLAHTRLSIIDLSSAAAQPMHYMGRYSIVYNGEIYNYIELKKDLKNIGYQFLNNSDTEVILAAYDFYGEKCLHYFDGMFAFAIWDEKKQQLFAARDRFGEKPFYYYSEKGLFVFGSEMKSLWAAGVPRQVDDKMILNYLTLGTVQNPADKSQTFFQHISSLLPAHSLLLDMKKGKFALTKYWNLDRQNQPLVAGKNYTGIFTELLTDSINKRLRSDVQVGSSLSGGLDSSSIVALVSKLLGQEKTAANFKTFSAIFPGFEKNEESHIQKVAEQFALKNFSVTPTADGLVNDFEKLCYHQEEPFPSSSIYAQYKVMELAAQNKTKVLLDGQGADETLAGYHKYLHWYLQELVTRHKFLQVKNARRQFSEHNISVQWGIKNILAAFLPAQTAITLEKREHSYIRANTDVSKKLLQHLKGREWDGIHKPIVNKLNDMLYFNTMEFGLEEMLRYADRSSMAHGVEVRLPFLNAALVQFIFNCPTGFKIRDGYTKWILRKSMENMLPGDLVWRTDKVGYEPPQKQWMEHPVLIDYMHEAKKKLVKHDLLKPQVLQRKADPKHAHERNNYEWRYLCTAQLLG
ncbi:MAG: asparagine synthase (glutamine-hydrolyzing) [Rhizobacter sp.]|nr:asparagine synthase (glutamine-hydrolyzing) [Ferruginibacter sp.]